MKRISYIPYILIIGLLCFICSLPATFTMTIRSFSIGTIAPAWHGLFRMKKASFQLFTLPTRKDVSAKELEDQIKDLQRENRALTTQLDNLRSWLLNEDRVQEQLDRLQGLRNTNIEDPRQKDFFRRRAEEIAKILELQMQALPAKVIYREPASWSSFLWVNIGQKHNKALGRVIVEKNSPVIVNGCIIGLVEDVRNSQSRVRLITDTHLSLSVRSLRGKQQNEHLLHQIDSVQSILENRQDLFRSPHEKKIFFTFFSKLKSKLISEGKDEYLAKGEIHGGSTPLWRSRTSTLYGLGFNFDRSDSEGEARDLITGIAQGSYDTKEAIPLLKEGDLLITTGFDGVFPAGLPVAAVKKIESLREGASAYEIKAEAVAGNLSDLSTVFILPANPSEGFFQQNRDK
ncbi:MAG: hypothetical protein EBZ47_05005 [Chlamydiae bacterium]|nr:hypothetical protein [Chlamydiota bacterium]